MTTPGVRLPWPAYLDALGDWLRRTEDDVLHGTAPEAFALEADGPLDPAGDPRTVLRARVLLDGLQRVEALARERRSALARASAYAQH